MGSLASLTPLIDELADHLSAAGLGAVGSKIYLGEMPETASDALLIVELPGPPPDMYVETETHLFDFWVRSGDTHQAYAMMQQVYEVFQRKANYTLTNWYIYFSYASATIRDEDRDREGDKLLALTVTFITRNLNHIS